MHCVKRISKAAAIAIFRKYGLDVIMWTSSTMNTGKYQGIICDYTKMKGYTVAYACEVWDVKGSRQVERFNIMR